MLEGRKVVARFRAGSQTGTFLAFGIDYQEVNNGVGNYSTVLMELPDGSIQSAPVCICSFIKE